MSITRQSPPTTTVGDVRREDLARRLRRLLATKQWNQSELARRTGVGRDVISGYMNGRHYPDAQNQSKLAQAFGLTLEEMFPEMAALTPSNVPMGFQSHEDGTATLNVNKRVPVELAIEVLALLAKA